MLSQKKLEPVIEPSTSAMEPAEQDCKLHLQLVLRHLKTGVEEHRQISFSVSEAPCLAVKIFKLAVEMMFNIPTFVQTLIYDTVELKDEDSLKGCVCATGHITHLGTADVRKVYRAPEYLNSLSNWIRDNLTTSMLPPRPRYSTNAPKALFISSYRCRYEKHILKSRISYII